jgi:hypothetical protein
MYLGILQKWVQIGVGDLDPEGSETLFKIINPDL